MTNQPASSCLSTETTRGGCGIKLPVIDSLKKCICWRYYHIIRNRRKLKRFEIDSIRGHQSKIFIQGAASAAVLLESPTNRSSSAGQENREELHYQMATEQQWVEKELLMKLLGGYNCA